MSDDKYRLIAQIYEEIAAYAKVAVGDNYDGDEVGRSGDMRHTKIAILEEIIRSYKQRMIDEGEAAELLTQVDDFTERIKLFRRHTDRDGQGAGGPNRE